MTGAAPGAGQPRPQPRIGGAHVVEWSCELAGTALLLLGGLSAVCLDFGTGSPVARLLPATAPRLLLTGLLFAGTGALISLTPIGRRSGAHLNPAMTIAFWVQGHLHRDDLVGYVLAQVAGGVLGAAAVRLLWGDVAVSVRDGRTIPGGGLGAPGATLVEAAMTAGLVLVVFALVSSPRTARLTPLFVWVYVSVMVWQVAPYTGTSMNPARSLGPAAVAGTFAYAAVYVVGPVGGALFAAGGWRLVGARQTLTAKLFHDARYTSTMASALPAMTPGRS